MARNRSIDHVLIHLTWPDAIRIEDADSCPCCHYDELYSFVVPEFDKFSDDGTYQLCGYACTHCGWSNAGMRNISQIDIAARGGGGKGEPV